MTIKSYYIIHDLSTNLFLANTNLVSPEYYFTQDFTDEDIRQFIDEKSAKEFAALVQHKEDKVYENQLKWWAGSKPTRRKIVVEKVELTYTIGETIEPCITFEDVIAREG